MMSARIRHALRDLTFFAVSGLPLACKPTLTTQWVNLIPVKVVAAAGQVQPPLDMGIIRLDAKGAPKGVLILVRDLIVQPSPGKNAVQPSCLAPLPQSFGAIARGVCLDHEGLSVEITPSQVRQECYMQPTDKPVAPTQPLLLPGCGTMKLEGYRFEPALRLDIEAADSPFVK